MQRSFLTANSYRVYILIGKDTQTINVVKFLDGFVSTEPSLTVCTNVKNETGSIFTKCNLVRAIRSFQPITVRITFRIIDEARPEKSYLYEAGLVQSSGLLRYALA